MISEYIVLVCLQQLGKSRSFKSTGITYKYVDILNDEMSYGNTEILRRNVNNVYYLYMWVL